MLYVRQINTNQFKCEIILDRFLKFEWGINTQYNERMTKSNLNPNQITKQRPFINMYSVSVIMWLTPTRSKNCPKINIFAVFVSCLDVNFIGSQSKNK